MAHAEHCFLRGSQGNTDYMLKFVSSFFLNKKSKWIIQFQPDLVGI